MQTSDQSYWDVRDKAWRYDAVLWLSYRMIEQAYLDTLPPKVKPAEDGEKTPRRWMGVPADEALLARDWIATSESLPPHIDGDYVSFPECCERLGINADAERMALLERIDTFGDFDSDEAWERLEVLSQAEPKDDVEPIFAAFRVVPALDQFTMFNQMEQTQ